MNFSIDTPPTVSPADCATTNVIANDGTNKYYGGIELPGNRPVFDSAEVQMELYLLGQRMTIATAAMQGLLAHYGGANPKTVAKMAVENADALIARLNQEKE